MGHTAVTNGGIIDALNFFTDQYHIKTNNSHLNFQPLTMTQSDPPPIIVTVPFVGVNIMVGRPVSVFKGYLDHTKCYFSSFETLFKLISYRPMYQMQKNFSSWM